MKNNKIHSFKDNGPTGLFSGIKKLFKGEYTKFDGSLAGDLVDSAIKTNPLIHFNAFGLKDKINASNQRRNNRDMGRPEDMNNPDSGDTSWMSNPNDPRWDYYDDSVSSNGTGANNNYRGNQGEMMRPADEMNSGYGGSYGPSARKKFIMHPDLKNKK